MQRCLGEIPSVRRGELSGKPRGWGLVLLPGQAAVCPGPRAEKSVALPEYKDPFSHQTSKVKSSCFLMGSPCS